MHGANLDLLRTVPHHPDGRAKDSHAHHRAEHLARLQAARRARRRAALSRLLGLVQSGGPRMKVHTAP